MHLHNYVKRFGSRDDGQTLLVSVGFMLIV